MVIKKLPGAAPVYMVYDLRDRLVLTQDGHQRTTNQWMFTKYDCFNRPVMNGIRQITSPASLAGVQGLVDTYYSTPSTPPPGYAENTNTSTVGYSLNQSYSNDVTEANLLTITYYDNNLFTGFQSFAGSTDLGVTSYNSKVITKVTGGRVRVLGDNTHWYISTTYYDDRYRPIQSIKDNYLSGTERITNLYDFPGKILRSYSQHNGLQAVNENRWFSYDHAGRLLSIYHQIDGQPARVLMSSMTYNELGQLQNKKIHSTDVSYFNYLQSIDYRYNIRGWLTKLNDPQTVGLPHSSEGNLIIKPDAFGMELRYTNPF
jgi:hypothetical protein